MNTAENLHYLPGHEPDTAPKASRRPQLEDGYTRTVNALVEAFARAPLTSREARVIRVVERMTYGWNKSEDWIAASVISDMTGISEGKCSETLNALIRKRVLSRNGGGRSPVRINKNISEWDFSAQKSRVTPKRNAESDWGDSPQDGVSKPPQDGGAPKDRKDNTPSLRSGVGASKKKSGSQSALKYTEEFEAAWSLYPKRSGSNPKREAFKSWNARMSEGFSTEDMISGLERYAAHVFAKGNSGTEFVMQGKRFFGPSAEFENDWFIPAPRADQYGAQGGNHANRQGSDQQRNERDRIAQRLADPNDDGWMDGLFEEDPASGAGEPNFYPAGSDLSEDVANGIQHGKHADSGQAGSGYIDGEVVNASDESGSGCSYRADQGRGRGVAAERGASRQDASSEAGGFWNA